MIKIENVVLPSVDQWKGVIRAMRNPMNSWDKSDSGFALAESVPPNYQLGEIDQDGYVYSIGPNDKDLMVRLAKAGTDHRKFMRMIPVMMDITAPLFYLKEADTYKVGTVRNSCSTMHKIHAFEFSVADFSHEGCYEVDYAYGGLLQLIDICERLRNDFNTTHDKKYWRALIEILPEGYNMRSTFTMNYEVLANIYRSRRDHKLQEWRDLCSWIETLPISELITGEC